MLIKETSKLSFELKEDLGEELNFNPGICTDSHQRGQENEKLG